MNKNLAQLSIIQRPGYTRPVQPPDRQPVWRPQPPQPIWLPPSSHPPAIWC